MIRPMVRVVKTFMHPKGQLRAHVVQRDNGTYGFLEEELWSGQWLPSAAYAPDAPISICDSALTAEREATSRIDWLRIMLQKGDHPT